MEITYRRRHTKSCPDKSKGPHFLKCTGKRPCPLWAFGYDDNGTRVRVSLKTRDRQRGDDRLAELKKKPAVAPRDRRTIAAAGDAFLLRHSEKGVETKRLYKRYVKRIVGYLETAGVEFIDQVKLETFDPYIAANEKASHTWLKNVEILKALLRFWMLRKWCDVIDLAAIRVPRLEEQNEVVPYTTEELDRIAVSCEFLESEYQRRRATTAALLMRLTGVRVSDVVTLKREHLQGALLAKRAHKNKKWIRITLPANLIEALQRLPRPIGAPTNSPYFFASGTASVRSLVTGMERLMSAVFDLAKVPGASCHRNRHTVATRLLGKGWSVDEVAEYLADAPATIRKHYAKWTRERQIRQDSMLLDIVHDTKVALTEGVAATC